MKIDVTSPTGTKAGSAELPDALFGITPNVAVLHQVVRRAARASARRHAQHEDACRGRRWRREAVAPEGHRPRPPRIDPLAAVAWRRDRPRSQAP